MCRHTLRKKDSKEILPEDATPTSSTSELSLIASPDGESKAKARLRILLGVFLTVFAGFLFTIVGFIIKHERLDFIDTLIVRSLLQTSTSGIYMLVAGIAFLPNKKYSTWKTQVFLPLQGLAGGVMILASFMCVLYMPFGDALTIMFTSPAVTAILSAIFLKHHLGVYKMGFICTLMTGTVLIIQPPFLFPKEETGSELATKVSSMDHHEIEIEYRDESLYWVGVGIAFLYALSNGSSNVIASGPLKGTKSIVTVFYVGVAGIIISVCYTFFNDNDTILSENIAQLPLRTWGILFGLAAMGVVGYYCLIQALRLMDPTLVSVTRSWEIMFGFCLQAYFSQTWPSVLALVGAIIAMVSVVLIALRNVIIRKLDFIEVPKWV